MENIKSVNIEDIADSLCLMETSVLLPDFYYEPVYHKKNNKNNSSDKKECVPCRK